MPHGPREDPPARQDVSDSALGALGKKGTGRGRVGLVAAYQKNRGFVMASLHAKQRLDAQRHREIEPGLGILQVEACDLTDPFEPVPKRVGVHTKALRCLLLLAGLEVGTQSRHQRALARAVVLDEGTEVAAAVVDQPLVAYRGEQAREPQLGN